jgi:anti-sigma regulatory factor (Ser/Thr protein kinase)
VREEVSLPPLPASVAKARRFVLSKLGQLGVSDPGDVALVVSELVTNAVVHAGTAITVRVGPGPAGVRIEIADESRDLPGLRIPNPGAKSGRGLLLVEHFTQAWGVEQTPSGKVVWFIVPQESG